jgi:hypothetical protein
MTIKVDFIACKHPWRKTYIKRGDELEIKGVKPCFYVTSYRQNFQNLRDYHNGLIDQGAQGRALLRGLLRHALDEEPRAGKIDKRARTKLLIFDVDGLKATGDPKELVTQYLGLPDVDMSVVYTSSYRIKPGLRCLISIELREEMPFAILKESLWALQLRNPILADEIHLDASQQVLVPPIDPSSSVPSQLFTIAPPQITPKSLDPFHDDPLRRYQFIRGKSRTLPTHVLTDYNDEDLYEQRAALLVQRRAERGVPTAKTPSVVTRTDKSSGIEWNFVENPAPALVTEIIDAGEYVRSCSTRFA